MRKQHADTLIERENFILDTATDVFIRYGYDKTTMSDIAERAVVTRAIVYLHFESKEHLFEVLLAREMQHYLQNWLESFENSAQGLSAGRLFGCVFGSSIQAVQRSALLSALVRQDRHVFGKYLRKPGGVLQDLQNRSTWPAMLEELQKAGAVREDIRPEVMGHIFNALALGIIALEEEKPGSEQPIFEAVLEGIADLFDRVLTPAGGGNAAAGYALIRQFALAAEAQLKAGGPARASSENQKKKGIGEL